MRDAMNQEQIQRVAAALREIGDYGEVQKIFTGWEPSFWDVNKGSFHRIAGIEIPKPAAPDPKAKK